MSTPTTDTTITMYWRPGCGFCAGLQRGLDSLGVAWSGVNIWEDPVGAELVRAANSGNELVPTVTVGNRTLSNPSPAQVLAAVHEQDPDSDLPKPSGPGAVGRGIQRMRRG